MAEEAAGGALAGSVEAPVARREGVAGSVSSSRPPTSKAPWAWKTGGSEEWRGAACENGTADAAAETATG